MANKKKSKDKKEKVKPDVDKCNLTISDWINYISSLINSLDNKYAHYESMKIGFITVTIALTALIGGLILPLTFKPEDPFQSVFQLGVIIAGMYILVYAIEKGLDKSSSYYLYCVKEMRILIDKIIQGKLNNSDSIRNHYNNARKKIAKDHPNFQKKLY